MLVKILFVVVAAIFVAVVWTVYRVGRVTASRTRQVTTLGEKVETIKQLRAQCRTEDMSLREIAASALEAANRDHG